MSNTTQTAQILKLSGMSDDASVAAVTRALEAVPGVIAVAVDLREQRATVIMRADVTRRQLVAAVESAGISIAG